VVLVRGRSEARLIFPGSQRPVMLVNGVRLTGMPRLTGSLGCRSHPVQAGQLLCCCLEAGVETGAVA